MRDKLLVLAVIAGTAGLAAAQPGPPQPPTEGAGTVEVDPPPQPQPPQPPPPPREPMMHHMAMPEENAAHRPSELAIAIGLGYALPTALDMPNTTSVRLRLPSGLTFEPRVIIGNTSTTNDSGGGTSTSNATTQLSLATLVRLPLISHGRTDFEGLGSVGLDTLKDNPDGDNNDTTTTTIGFSWGVAVGYWIGPHWQVSLSAQNPLINYTSVKHQIGAGMETKTSTTSIGVIFDPRIVLMVHLYN